MDGYPLEQSLGADFGYEKGAPNGRLDGNGYTKRQKYPLKQQSFGSKARAEIGYSIGSSDGKVISSVGISSCVFDVTPWMIS